MSDWDKIWVNCREATYLEELRHEGKINFHGRLGLWIHLLYCRFCKLFIRQSRAIANAASGLAKNYESAEFTMSREKKDALQRALKNE